MFTSGETQWLSRANFEPTAVRRIRHSLRAIVAALLLAGAAGLGLSRLEEFLAPPARLVEMTKRNAALGEEIERARMDLKMERATREELQRQIDAMSQQLTELNHQLEFLSSRNAQRDRAN